MPIIRPFRGIRPAEEHVESVYVYHGDAGDEARSRARATTHPNSMLHVSRADLLLSEGEAKDETLVRKQAREALQAFKDHGVLIKDERECLYILRLSMANHSQTGIVAIADVRDYIEGTIKRHELTRIDKTYIQQKVIERVGGNIEPVLLAYDSDIYSDSGIEGMLEHWALSHDPTYDFFDAGGVRHELWAVDEGSFIEGIQNAFSMIDSLYICDGHHRIAASAEYYVENEDVKADGPTNAELEASREEVAEKSKYFMVAVFPSSEMLILDYNRAVKDLNGLTENEFLDALNAAHFTVEEIGSEPTYPSKSGEYTMVMNNTWYRLNYTELRDMSDPVAGLDVSLLQNKVLRDILGIRDPQHDDRITFISGNKGLEALQNATNNDMKVAFAIEAPTMHEIMRVSDSGLTMPPKSTFFEPKLVSGLLVYEI